MRIAVLLGGCGLYDGSDTHETVLTLLALEGAGEKPVLLAPDIDQDRTVDHLTGDEVPEERRNVLRESARLARGSIQALSAIRPDDLEALIIPGGYGPVVNLSTGFAQPGRSRRVHPAIESFIRHFIDGRKPIGLVGLGDVPVRTVLDEEIDVPPPPQHPGHLRIDAERLIVHTPGFSVFTRLHDVRVGVEAMVAELLRMMEGRSRQEAAGRAARSET